MTVLSTAGASSGRAGYRHRLKWFIGVVLVSVVLAWLVPVTPPPDTHFNADRPLGDAPRNPPPEDLTAFLDVNRWGVSLREVNARIAEEEAQRLGRRPGLNPALKALGYVGLVVEADADTVLLATTGGAVARLEPGDTLPDGRILARVQGNSIALRAAEGGEVEVLELFPRPPTRAEDRKEAP